MPANPYCTYQEINKEGMPIRELEASVLTKAALMLKQCQTKWECREREALLDEAIRYNQMIWSFFQSELTQEDNPLPRQLREDILNLSLFIDRRLFEILAFPEQQKLSIIIDINLNLAAGLRTTPELEAAAATG